MLDRIHQLVESTEEWAIQVRRDLHMFPEVGDEEIQTTSRIKAELEKMGIETRSYLKTGIVGILKGSKGDGKCVALRADIDALPMQEETNLEYASKRPGYMHACGHDIHTAVLLGAAKVLSQIKDQLKGSIKFIFQPAEETTGGAQRMIEAGCMEDPKVDFITGLHVSPEIDAGKIAYQYGQVNASSDMFEIVVHGKKAHGAYPHQGIDAIVAGSAVVTALQSLVSRNIAPVDACVVTIGTFHSGTVSNIIADRVEMAGTLRTLSPEAREMAKNRIVEITQSVAKAYGASTEVRYIPGYDALINTDQIVDLVKDTAVSVLGETYVEEFKVPSMGVEDFSFFLNHAPGAFYYLGTGFPDQDNPGIHNGRFHVNEKAISTGILMQTMMALQLMEKDI